MHTTGSILMGTLRYAARKYWNKWKATSTKPSLQVMHKLFSGVFVSEYGATGKLDEVMRRAKPVLKKFVDLHPQMTPLLVGTSFETPFPIPGAKVIIKDSIDLIYQSLRGTENIIVIASGSEHEHSILRATIAHIGYQSMKTSNPYVVKIFREKAGFVNVKIGERHLGELVAASELLSLLHNSKNKSKHTGLACKGCPYQKRCWRGT
jgi:hypothetical protein